MKVTTKAYATIGCRCGKKLYVDVQKEEGSHRYRESIRTCECGRAYKVVVSMQPIANPSNPDTGYLC